MRLGGLEGGEGVWREGTGHMIHTWKLVAVPGLEMVIEAGTGPIPKRRSAVADLMAYTL